MYQIWRIYLDLWDHDCKKWFWPTFGSKLGQNDPIVMQPKLDMSCHLLNIYTKFQNDISTHVEEKSGKRGRTDGRTLPRHNTSRFSNGRIKICNDVSLVMKERIIWCGISWHDKQCKIAQRHDYMWWKLVSNNCPCGFCGGHRLFPMSLQVVVISLWLHRDDLVMTLPVDHKLTDNEWTVVFVTCCRPQTNGK